MYGIPGGSWRKGRLIDGEDWQLRAFAIRLSGRASRQKSRDSIKAMKLRAPLKSRVVLGFALAVLISGPAPVHAQNAGARKREPFGSSLKRLSWDEEKRAAFEAAPPEKRSDAAGETSLRIETSLAVFDVLVLDAQGRPITGLAKEDFVVAEDGRPQELATFTLGDGASIVRSIVLILDHSGSQLPFLQTSVEAAKTLVDKLGSNDRMAIVTDDVELLQDFTQDKGKLKKKLDSLKRTRRESLGRSEQYSALFAVLRELVTAEEHPTIIFQTDGDELNRLRAPGSGATPEWYSPFVAVKPYSLQDIFTAAEKSRTTIYTIVPGLQIAGLSPSEQVARARLDYAQRVTPMLKERGAATAEEVRARMQYLPDSYFHRMIATQQRQQLAAAGIAKLSGGWAEFLEQPEQAAGIYERILTGINRRYIIGYYPTNEARDGKLRRVRIEVRGHPEYKILGKQSYYARQ